MLDASFIDQKSGNIGVSLCEFSHAFNSPEMDEAMGLVNAVDFIGAPDVSEIRRMVPSTIGAVSIASRFASTDCLPSGLFGFGVEECIGEFSGVENIFLFNCLILLW